MTVRRYHYACTLSWGGDEPTAELEIECSYTVAWGAPEKGPSYGSGGQPADPDEIDDIKIVSVDGKPWPVDLSYGFMSDAATHNLLEEKLLADHEDWMVRHATDQDDADRDEAADRRFREVRDDDDQR
jgi:hypothetical protein